jgi:hypothetical protein
MELKQKFLFAFSMNLRKVRDLTIHQRRKLVPLWIAQVEPRRTLKFVVRSVRFLFSKAVYSVLVFSFSN